MDKFIITLEEVQMVLQDLQLFRECRSHLEARAEELEAENLLLKEDIRRNDKVANMKSKLDTSHQLQAQVLEVKEIKKKVFSETVELLNKEMEKPKLASDTVELSNENPKKPKLVADIVDVLDEEKQE